MRTFSRFSTLTLALVSLAPLHAQETTGTLVGTATDLKSGMPLSGVRIILRSPKLLQERAALTDKDGNYRIPLLPNGDYTIATSKENYAGGTTRCAIQPGLVVRQNLRLAHVDTQGVVVEVVANAATQVDKTQTQTQSVFTQERLTSLSTSDLLKIADIAPGVVKDSNESGTVLHIRGGNSTGGKFLVNGMPAGEAGWGSFKGDQVMVADMIESVAVIQSPLNARYGNTESGIVSYVTNRGSNEFKGTLRANYSRSTLGATSVNGLRQQARFGQDWDPRQVSPWDDPIGRNYEATFSGPLWKDHLTFAWGGRFQPNSTGQSFVPRWWTDYNNGRNVVSHDFANTTDGTIFVTPGGAQIRRGDLWDQGKYYNYGSTAEFNQYALFYQINPNHSLEWSYSKSLNSNTDFVNRDWTASLNPGNYGTTGVETRIWNLGYKAAFSESVLEARLGRNTNISMVPASDGSPYVRSSTNRTWENGNYKNGMGGIPGAQLYTWDQLRNGASGNTWYPYRNLLEARKYQGWVRDEAVMGSPFDQSETKSTTSFYVNWQVFRKGHQIDVGMNYEKTDWDTSVGAAPLQFFTSGGRIARNLTAMDLLYPAGYTGPQLDPAAYAGKWVTWSSHSKYLDLWPGADDAASLLNGRPYAYQWFGSPTMRMNMGPDQGSFNQPTTSFYINDLWTLNEHFSMMGGLRFDMFKLNDSRGKVFSYNMLTPRFELKWDPQGDQKRLVSFSYGRFHNRIPAAVYQAFVQRRKPYVVNYSWDPTVDGLPFDENNPSAHPLVNNGYRLVDTADLINPKNYTHFRSMMTPDAARLDPNFKADYSDELTLSFRRAYENGSSWRATLVRREWKNNYQWFVDPHVYTATNPYLPGATADTFASILKSDPGLFHRYYAAELEWNFVLSKKLVFGGNAVFSRNFRNQMYWSAQENIRVDNIGTNHRAWGINWADLWKRFGYGTEDITQAELTSSHVVNVWFTYDLTRGEVKSSLALRGAYTRGDTYTQREQLFLDPYSAAYQARLGNVPADYPKAAQVLSAWGNYIWSPQRGTYTGGFQNPDHLDLFLKYNLEVPIARKLAWWVSIEVYNPFNWVHATNRVTDTGATWNPGSNYVDGSRPAGNYSHNGYQMEPWNLQLKGPNYYGGDRSFTVESGFRF